MNHSHEYKDTILSENPNTNNGFQYDRASNGFGSNGGRDYDNVNFTVNRFTDSFSENRRVYPETYTELSSSEPKNKGDVWNPEEDVFRLSSSNFLGQRYWQKTSEASYKEVSDQKQYDNRPAYFELVYLIYFGK